MLWAIPLGLKTNGMLCTPAHSASNFTPSVRKPLESMFSRLMLTASLYMGGSFPFSAWVVLLYNRLPTKTETTAKAIIMYPFLISLSPPSYCIIQVNSLSLR